MKHGSTMVAIGLSSLLLAGCSSKAESQFVKGCEQMADRSVCKCIYSELEDQYGEDDLKKKLYTIDQDEEFQMITLRVTMQCARDS